MFQALALDFTKAETIAQKARELEHIADDLAHTIIDDLNKTFITPFEREDIYLLTHELDDVIDLIENAISTIVLYNIEKPRPGIKDFSELMQKAAVEVDHLLTHLKSQKYTEPLRNTIITIHELEDQGDAVFGREIRALFEHEKDPLMVIKWKDVLEDLENVMDTFQRVSNTIESILVKSS